MVFNSPTDIIFWERLETKLLFEAVYLLVWDDTIEAELHYEACSHGKHLVVNFVKV